MWASQEYKHLINAQRVVGAKLADRDTSARDIAQLARALVCLIEMKRIIRMRPKPRDLDTLDPRLRKAIDVQAIGWSESDEPKESLSGPDRGGGTGGGEGNRGSDR